MPLSATDISQASPTSRAETCTRGGRCGWRNFNELDTRLASRPVSSASSPYTTGSSSITIPPLEELAEPGHLPQRLLQVVGGHVGELFEVTVGPGQLLGLGLQPAVGLFDLMPRLDYLGEVGHDLSPHGVDVPSQAADFERPAATDLVVVLATRHPAYLAAELDHRTRDQPAQQQAQHGAGEHH